MRLHSQLHNLHNMKLLVRETTGEMAEFEVDNDFQYPENKFWATQGGYVMTKVDGKMVYVHRIVLGLSAGNRKQGHHIDENVKNNTTTNLRIVTNTENSRYKGPSKESKTGLKGVYKRKNGKYKAVLMGRIDGRQYNKYLGNFATKKEAGLAYDRAALARFAGAFLNFPNHVHQSIVTV